MRHQPAVEHGVDRAAETDRLNAADRQRGVDQRAKLQPGAAVVEQHAAVQVAHHHALRQLGHQRGQPAALLLDAAAGFAHLAVHVAAQAGALLNQLVDHLSQPLRGRRAILRRQRMLRVAGQQHLCLFGQPRRGRYMANVQPVQQPARQRKGNQPAHEQQRRARTQEPGHQRLLGAFQRGPQQAQRGQQPGRQRHAQRGHRQQPAPVDLHGFEASSARTLSTSSRVAKGLVT